MWSTLLVVALLWVSLWWIPFASALIDHDNDFAPHTLQTVDIHRSSLRRSLRSRGDGEPFRFAHVSELLATLRAPNRPSTFEATELFTAENAKKWKLSSFEDMRTKGYYHAITSYTLHPEVAYVDYDTIHNVSVGRSTLESYSDTHIEHCAASEHLNALADVKPHAALLGSTHGGWTNTRLSTSEASATNTELVFVHRVLSVTPHTVTRDETKTLYCLRAELLPLHPWELFSRVTVQALVEHPFDRLHGTRSASASPHENEKEAPEDRSEDRSEERRKLQLPQPDTPLMACNNPAFANVGASVWNPYVVKMPYLAFNKNQGCAMYQRDLPGSFSANYDINTRKAMQTFRYGPLTCDNCFVVAGAGALAVMNYVSTWHGQSATVRINVQLKLAGRAGASVSFQGTRPGSFSGSQEFALANFAGNTVSIPIGSAAIVLTLQFAGASLKIAGSGSFVGNFSVGFGRLGTASLGLMSTNSAPRFVSELRWDNLDSPFTSNGFHVADWTLASEVIARVNLQLAWGGALLANFNFYLGTTVGMTSPNGMGPSMNGTMLVSQRSTRRRLSSSSSIRPGDKLRFSHSFSEFRPHETVDLYYTLKSLSTGNQYPILNAKMKTGSTGSGSVHQTWTLPWDLDFSPLGQQVATRYGTDAPSSLKEWKGSPKGRRDDGSFVVQVRNAYLMDACISTSQPFSIAAFTAHDGVFSTPASGQTVTLETPFKVKWDATLLRRFEHGMHTWTGRYVRTDEVILELIGEQLDAVGKSIVDSTCIPLTAGAKRNKDGFLVHPNSGSAVVTLHANMTARFDRFYLLVSDAKKRQVQGWSKEYFTVVPQAKTGAGESKAAMAARPANLRTTTGRPTRDPYPSSPGSISKYLSHLQLLQYTRGADVEMGPLDPRILQTMRDRSLFGGKSDRLSIYMPLSVSEPASVSVHVPATDDATDDDGTEATDASRALQSSPSDCNTPLKLPWSVSIFGGAGFSSVRIPYTSDQTLGLMARADLLSMTGSIAVCI